MLGLAAAHFFGGHFQDAVNLIGRILAEVPSHNVARRYRAALAHLALYFVRDRLLRSSPTMSAAEIAKDFAIELRRRLQDVRSETFESHGCFWWHRLQTWSRSD